MIKHQKLLESKTSADHKQPRKELQKARQQLLEAIKKIDEELETEEPSGAEKLWADPKFEGVGDKGFGLTRKAEDEEKELEQN